MTEYQRSRILSESPQHGPVLLAELDKVEADLAEANEKWDCGHPVQCVIHEQGPEDASEVCQWWGRKDVLPPTVGQAIELFENGCPRAHAEDGKCAYCAAAAIIINAFRESNAELLEAKKFAATEERRRLSWMDNCHQMEMERNSAEIYAKNLMDDMTAVACELVEREARAEKMKNVIEAALEESRVEYGPKLATALALFVEGEKR